MENKWFSHEQAHGGVRHRLYVRDNKLSTWTETPFFVDAAPNSAHYTYGRKYGLYGSGMGTLMQTQNPYRIAACFGGFDKLTDAKLEALAQLQRTS